MISHRTPSSCASFVDTSRFSNKFPSAYTTSSGLRSAEFPFSHGSRCCRVWKMLSKASAVEGGGMVVAIESGRWSEKNDETERSTDRWLVIAFNRGCCCEPYLAGRDAGYEAPLGVPQTGLPPCPYLPPAWTAWPGSASWSLVAHAAALLGWRVTPYRLHRPLPLGQAFRRWHYCRADMMMLCCWNGGVGVVVVGPPETALPVQRWSTRRSTQQRKRRCGWQRGRAWSRTWSCLAGAVAAVRHCDVWTGRSYQEVCRR